MVRETLGWMGGNYDRAKGKADPKWIVASLHQGTRAYRHNVLDGFQHQNSP